MHAASRRLVHAARRVASSSSSSSTVYTRTGATRSLHARRKLPYDVDAGMGAFLSPEGLRTVAVEYQQGLLDRLNEEIRNTDHVNKSVAQIVVDTAQDRDATITFNYASAALNNDFFLQNLKQPTSDAHKSHETELFKSPLYAQIVTQYHSLDVFKSTFSAAAMGLSASGWVWAVCDSNANLGVVATHGNGTLLVAQRAQTSPPDLHDILGGMYVTGSTVTNSGSGHVFATRYDTAATSATSSPVSGTHVPPSATTPHPPAQTRALSASALRANYGTGAPRPASLYDQTQRATGSTALQSPAYGGSSSSSARTENEKIGGVLYPLFCVSVHEHAWITSGHGLWGREAYLKQFWTVLDWESVQKAYTRLVPRGARPGLGAAPRHWE